MADPRARLDRAAARLAKATAVYEAAVEERKAAIVAAYEAGMTLDDIAGTLGVDHEVARRIVRRAGR